MARVPSRAPRRTRVKAERAPTTPDPIEIAMEAEASGEAAEGIAHEVLRKQSALIGWQIASERAALGIRVLLGLAGLVVAVVLGTMVWSAAKADGLVIEAIEAPPDIVQQGFSGSALAARLQDRLNRMQRETIGTRATTALREARDSDVKIQIPNTGISLGEVDRYLRSRLGHETAVRGELVKLEAGPQAGALALSVRIGAQPGVEVVSPTRDVNELLQRGAEEIYRARDLARYLSWLAQNGRVAEAETVARGLTAAGSASQRSLALNFLAGRSAGFGDEAAVQRRAVRLDPSNCNAWNGLGVAAFNLGHNEESLRTWQRAVDCYKTAPGFSPAGREFNLVMNRMNVMIARQARWDALQLACAQLGVAPCSPETILATAQAGLAGNEVDSNIGERLQVATRMLANSHAGSDATRLLPFQQPPSGAPANAIRYWLATAGYIAVSLGDWPRVIALAAEDDALHDDGADPVVGLKAAVTRGPIWPVVWRPYALAATGRQAEADAAVATLPLDCYFCLIVRAKVADAKGDRSGAERWLAEAVRQGPSIPAAYVELAALNLARGDADRALAYARAGHKASPRASEPLELWAEALLAKGKARAAAARFAEAAKLAPRWGRLHLKWGEALARLGKADEARAKWRAAATMDLSAADRAALKRHGV